jgi:hypothetical protein
LGDLLELVIGQPRLTCDLLQTLHRLKRISPSSRRSLNWPCV